MPKTIPFKLCGFMAITTMSVALFGCQNSTDQTPKAAEVSLQYLDNNGLQKLIQSHRGKVVVVDAWSST